MIHHGDCLDVMAEMEAESIDAIVTDPPYGLEFMGKAWDKLWDKRPERDYHSEGRTAEKWPTARPTFVAGTRAQAFHARWAEAAYRVAKPSAYLLAFGGTRTVHRMTVALEDAGWIIRDMLVWAYASGFPKSKASLKPAWEPIVMARKPGPLRMLAIDECRIGVTDGGPRETSSTEAAHPPSSLPMAVATAQGDAEADASPSGRWPANVILSDAIFDGGVQGVAGGGDSPGEGHFPEVDDGVYGVAWNDPLGPNRHRRGDRLGTGTYSRFFLVPKASRSDREPVLTPDWFEGTGRVSNHPTVKPTELMRHLVRLVTPVGGVVLDPFGGSGTTAVACELEGFPWLMIEKEGEYVRIAEARLNGTQRGLGLDVPAPTRPKTFGKQRGNKDDSGNPTLASRRSPSENWSGRWTGTDLEEPA